jgi:hypothetical protein
MVILLMAIYLVLVQKAHLHLHLVNPETRLETAIMVRAMATTARVMETMAKVMSMAITARAMATTARVMETMARVIATTARAMARVVVAGRVDVNHSPEPQQALRDYLDNGDTRPLLLTISRAIR